jgi:hypothetical protein
MRWPPTWKRCSSAEPPRAALPRRAGRARREAAGPPAGRTCRARATARPAPRAPAAGRAGRGAEGCPSGPLFWSSLIVVGYVAVAGVAGLYMLRALRAGAGREDPEEAQWAAFDDPPPAGAEGSERRDAGADGRAG